MAWLSNPFLDRDHKTQEKWLSLGLFAHAVSCRFWLGYSRRFPRPIHDMIGIIGKLDLIFGRPGPILHGNPRLVHACGRSRDQRMPPGKIAALGDQAIGAARRQPGEFADLGWGQFDAVAHFAAPVRIIGAAAGSLVEEFAGDVGEMNFTGVLILQLDKAAAAAAIAQAFPFGGI